MKEYFFGLGHAERARVLHLYGQKYGEDARQYAEETIPRWQSGHRKMAGQTAARLFNLLPPLMPIHEKYRLTENLWRHVGPQSKRILRVGIDADTEQAVAKVAEHMEAIVGGYQIPDSLARRFEWISAGDVAVKQQILNHLQGLEKSLVVEAARQKIPVMLAHIRADTANHTKRFAEILKVGKHELEILIDRESSLVKLEEWRPQSTATGTSMAWLWWLVGLGVIIALFALRKH